MKSRDPKRKPTPEGIERGKRLRALRDLLGADYTQEKVAEMAGFRDRTDLTRLETGFNKGTARTSHEALARAFHLLPETIAELLDGAISPTEAHARIGEDALEVPKASRTRSPLLSDREEWLTVLEKARAAAEVLGDVAPQAWDAVAQVRDSPPFPRPLTPGFLLSLAKLLNP